MTPSSSPRASVAALPPPRPSRAPLALPDDSPPSGDVAKADRAHELERARLMEENAALRARLELLSSLGRSTWWDWDTQTERINAHGDLIELVHLELPPDLGAPGLGRWLDLIHPDDVRRARTVFVRCLADAGETASCELRVRGRSGGYRWVLLALTACVPAERTRPLRIIGAARDLQSERAQRDAAQRDAQVLGRLGDGIVCVDSAGSIGYLNAAAARLLGLASRDWLGRSLVDAFADDQREALRELLVGALDGASHRAELEPHGPHGERRAVDVELSAYADTSGRPLGVVCTLRPLPLPQTSR